ncbi:MAG: LysM peptidoglycan-binding domain-containing protein [Anaerotignaceae bacterium]
MQYEFPTDGSECAPKDFKFPSNIKQMGNVDRDLKIYMEDYVYTYLYQYARSYGGGEKLAVLVGRYMMVDDAQVVLISGAIQAKDTVKDKDAEIFTEESWNYINRQMATYFKNLCIIGWVHIQPDFGTYLMARDEVFHRECFKEMWQLLFVVDQSERADGFYVYNKDKSSLRSARGYFIYYDKNEMMQNYMIENSTIKPRAAVEEVVFDSKSSGRTAVERLLGIAGRRKSVQKTIESNIDRIDAASRIRQVLRKKEEDREKETKNRYVALTAICGSLCLACLMMCANLLSNRDRINRLEAELSSVQQSYTAINEMVETATAQVFAEKNTDTATESVELPANEKINVQVNEEPVAEQTGEIQVYCVEEGDSLWYISRKFYGTDDEVELIKKANGLDDENLIFLGEELIIPKR